MTISLHINGLSVGYHKHMVLRDVSVEARAGKFTAIIGPNAAGKTTLLRCIAGVLKPMHGHVQIGGKPVDHMSPRQLAQCVAYVAQRPMVATNFSVRSVVELGRYAQDPDSQAVDRAMRSMELDYLADRPYRELSVGQQQRVAVARAVAQSAGRGVLVLDEPIAAMDLSHSRDCLALLKRLAADGATIICAMHDLTFAAAVADDVWLVHDGRVEAGGACEVMQPSQLQSVFGVAFDWIERDGQPPLLVAEMGSGTRP